MGLRAFGYFLLNLYILAVIGRLIVDWVMAVNPSWRPQGLLLPVVDVVFRLTDAPLSFLRRMVPPLRLGAVAIDLSIMILLIGVQWFGGLLLRFLP